jgi:hypothetical protein
VGQTGPDGDVFRNETTGWHRVRAGVRYDAHSRGKNVLLAARAVRGIGETRWPHPRLPPAFHYCQSPSCPGAARTTATRRLGSRPGQRPRWGRLDTKRNAALRRLGQDAAAVAGDELVQNLLVGFRPRSTSCGSPSAYQKPILAANQPHLAFAHSALQLEAEAAHAVVERIGAR